MENTCTRCHQTIEDGSTYCATCGLPQLVYQADAAAGAIPPERRMEPARDAASISWMPAMAVAAKLAVPAGVVFAVTYLYSLFFESKAVGLLILMGGAAAWVVALYVRGQKPAWITIGAGARIGLVTGIFSAWTATAMCGVLLYGARYWFNAGRFIDNSRSGAFLKQIVDTWNTSGLDVQKVTDEKALLLRPQAQAEGFILLTCLLVSSLLVFAVAGGAMGARLLARPSRPENQ
jgi:hypothetical protein